MKQKRETRKGDGDLGLGKLGFEYTDIASGAPNDADVVSDIDSALAEAEKLRKMSADEKREERRREHKRKCDAVDLADSKKRRELAEELSKTLNPDENWVCGQCGSYECGIEGWPTRCNAWLPESEAAKTAGLFSPDDFTYGKRRFFSRPEMDDIRRKARDRKGKK